MYEACRRQVSQARMKEDAYYPSAKVSQPILHNKWEDRLFWNSYHVTGVILSGRTPVGLGKLALFNVFD